MILDNLVENAVEHTAPGTTVTVVVTAQNGWAGVAVDDEGPGPRRARRSRPSSASSGAARARGGRAGAASA